MLKAPRLLRRAFPFEKGALSGTIKKPETEARALLLHRDVPSSHGRRRYRPAVPSERVIQGAIAQKVLEAWLQNRHQTLYPLTLNFGSLSQDEKELMVQVMAAAATADGELDAEEQRQTELSLRTLGAGEKERELFSSAARNPLPLNRILDSVLKANLGPLAYGASLLAINQRNRVNRLYLEYLAARLLLSSEVVQTLNRRYRT